MKTKRIIAIFLLYNLLLSLFISDKNLYGASLADYKKFGLPLIGLSVLAGVGANYLRKEALKRYEEAENLWEAYMAIPAGSSYEEFEVAYEKYEDKYAEAVQYRNYYLICGGVAILSAAAGIYLVIYSSSSKIITLGYSPNYIYNQHNINLKVKF